jgi:hypothetical protein
MEPAKKSKMGLVLGLVLVVVVVAAAAFYLMS